LEKLVKQVTIAKPILGLEFEPLNESSIVFLKIGVSGVV